MNVLSKSSKNERIKTMKKFTAVIQKCPDTGLFIGYVPGVEGAHTQADTLDQLYANLHEVIEMLMEDDNESGDFHSKYLSSFVGTQEICLNS